MRIISLLVSIIILLQGLNPILINADEVNQGFKVAIAYENGNFNYVAKSDNLDSAMKMANELNVNEVNNEIASVLNAYGQVVYATKSIGKVVKHIDGNIDETNRNNSYIYPTYSSNSQYTYINHGYIDDIPIIEDKGNRAKVEVGGYTGWINKDVSSGNYDLEVVPLNQAKNPSYYKSVNGEIVHFISTNIKSDRENGYEITLGPAPDCMKPGIKYYSYDGNYFYEELGKLIEDAKLNNHNLSINGDNPYYNYYMNLTFRSKTSYSAEDINLFLENNTQQNSKLRGTGKAFIEAENKYGANALLVLGIAMNESAKGMSSIAQNKNNLFGINAVDSNPGQSANYFETVEECINQFTRRYISTGYADPQDWRHKGANLGDKKLGANVEYASDPFWGEKAARYAYSIDKYLSGNNIKELNDHDRYQLAIYTGENEVRSKDNSLLYSIKDGIKSNSGSVGNSLLITSNENYDNNNGETMEMYPDRSTPVSMGEFDGNYSWDKKAYVRESGIKLINKGKILSQNSSDIEVAYRSHVGGYGWQNWKYNGELSGTVEQSKRIEAIELNLLKAPEGAKIRYRTHVEGIGWMPWVSNGNMAGTVEQSKRVEAIQIEVEGLPEDYSVEYRGHVEGIGWMPWVSDGEIAGTVEQYKRLEAIEVRIVKGRIKPIKPTYNVSYRGHVEGIGWMPWISNGDTTGTVEQCRRLEALEIKLQNPEPGMKLRYRGHVEGIGWMPWVDEGNVVGTVEQSLRLEAVQIDLIGAPKDYHVEYRVHVEGIGWMPWVNDGMIAGTVEQYKRIEAIQLRVIKY
ncbi:glucosaminidase domain-containing protein [Paraclostridium bifermentans]|uniref:glucosaminidase domain-containing protein n=1 Tax=Paraclostridium bifermentans TaxID=1490 RepID=UPI00041F178E|nr:glucosaminidase domain-containing protein [Paraclostridium bifermentans]